MDITTNTIAELYIKQGYPEKAKDIYRAILELDPGNAAAAEKLSLLEGGADETPLETIAATAATTVVEQAVAETVPDMPAGVLDTSVAAQVARLEGWLANVQAVRGSA